MVSPRIPRLQPWGVVNSKGVPISVVSQMLGHTSAAFTQAVYVHTLPGMGRDAAGVISRALW